MKRSLLILVAAFCLLPFALCAQTVSTWVQPGSGIDDALLPDGNGGLFGSGYDSGNVYKVDSAGNSGIFAGGFGAANGLAMDGMGNLVVCDNTGDGIYKIAPDSSVSLFLGYPGPSGLIKDNLSDTLYFTNYPGNSIYKLAPDTSLTLFASGGGMNGPVGMAWDDNHNLIVGNFNNGNVYRIDAAGTIDTVGQFGLGVLGFLVYRDGYIYGTMFNNQRIFRMDSAGNTEFVAGSVFGQVDGPATTARFSRPNGIVLSSGGDSLLISDYTAKSVRVITGLDSVGIVGNASPFLLPAEVRTYPNPAQDAFRIGFELEFAAPVTVRLLDSQGREVLATATREYGTGQHAVDLNVADLARGVYFLRMQIAGEQVGRMVVLQ